MGVVEAQKAREELTRQTVSDFVLSHTGESLGLVSLMETSYNIHSNGKRVMTFGEREGILRLDVPYSELPEPLRKFVDRLERLGYQVPLLTR